MNAPAKPARSPWPIAITALFIVFALYLAGFIVWAVGQKQDLVAADYYEREVRYQDQLDRLHRTALLAPGTTVAFDAAARTCRIALPASHAAATGRIHFYRPSNARLDQSFPLALAADGTQVIPTDRLAAGRWKVRVEWQVGGQDFYVEQPLEVN
jgi:nitrogen fixation protein FixH